MITLLKALHIVANRYGCNGTHDSDLIATAFRDLANEIEEQQIMNDIAEEESHNNALNDSFDQ